MCVCVYDCVCVCVCVCYISSALTYFDSLLYGRTVIQPLTECKLHCVSHRRFRGVYSMTLKVSVSPGFSFQLLIIWTPKKCSTEIFHKSYYEGRAPIQLLMKWGRGSWNTEQL